RSLLEQALGVTLTQKLKHVPYSQRVSVLQELESRFPEEFEATAQHQFRHPEDLSIPAALSHYWAYVTGRGMPGRIRYTYADLVDPKTPVKLSKLLRRRNYDTLCLNDNDSDDQALRKQADMLADFLPKYFPIRSPLELSPAAEASRAGTAPTDLWNAEYGTTVSALQRQ